MSASPTILTGQLQRVDLGAGGWSLRTDDGTVHTLHGDVPAKLAGRRVEVRGRTRAAMGFLMQGGPVFEVDQIRSTER
jgi:hypothetical protein